MAIVMSTGRWLLGKAELHLRVGVILARLHWRRASVRLLLVASVCFGQPASAVLDQKINTRTRTRLLEPSRLPPPVYLVQSCAGYYYWVAVSGSGDTTHSTQARTRQSVSYTTLPYLPIVVAKPNPSPTATATSSTLLHDSDTRCSIFCSRPGWA